MGGPSNDAGTAASLNGHNELSGTVSRRFPHPKQVIDHCLVHVETV
jgi:hypothetical protein